ncbi:hypothetical protein ACFE04_028810 [Oxalis oulophora]
MEEFQRRLSNQNELLEDEDAIQKQLEDEAQTESKTGEDTTPIDTEEDNSPTQTEKEETRASSRTEMVEYNHEDNHYRVSEEQLEKQQNLVEQQQKDIQLWKYFDCGLTNIDHRSYIVNFYNATLQLPNGSERVDKSEVTGDRLKEAQHINKSLAALGDVIASLAQKGSHVPYRNSKLTQLLQDSLGGQAKTLMFVHISPEYEAVAETLSTLKFAERVATVELGAARVNKDSGDVKELKEQIANLKAALANKKKGEGDSPQYSRPSTPEKSKLKPSLSSQHSFGDMSNGHRQGSDGIVNTKIRKNSPAKPKRKSLDPQDLSRLNSPPWPSVTSSSASEKDDDKDSIISGDWVDKLVVNKGEPNFGRNGNHHQALQWELDNRQLPEEFYQTSLPDPTKIYPEHPLVKNEPAANNKKDNQECDLQRIRFEVGSTDDSDHEALTASSDCSETDMLWQVQVSKAATTSPNGVVKKTKKSQLKSIKSAESARSLIPSLIPPPTRKLPNGITPARHLSMMLDGKRRTTGK